MEIGHNVLHGQWDWMNDPVINSQAWDWDTASTSAAWKHSHNFVHHTYTNVLGKDRDIGYSAMRVSPEQPWHPIHLAQPIYNAALAKERSKTTGERYTQAASMAKLFASETAMFCAHAAVQIHGGLGYSKELPIERYFRDAKITEIYEGTSEIQRLVIARHELGLR